MPNWKKVITSGSDAALNTLIVTNGITGSLLGTASYADYATSASYARTASYAPNLTISGSINNVNYIDFNTGSATPTWKNGRIFWDNTEGALAVYNAEADITLQVGQENWTRVFNNTGVTITNGAAVRIIGTHGDHPEVVLAQSIQVSGSSNLVNQVLGLATHTIEDGTFGYVTTQGLVRGLNTNAFTDGATLYVSSSAGQLTSTVPDAPYEIIPIGQVVKASPGTSGIIYVAVQQPLDFTDLSSVYLGGGTYTDGDLWTYNGPQKRWEHKKQLSGSYGLTGSLSVLGNINATSLTGSLLGTASYASQALSSSYALTASYYGGSVLSASYALTSSTTNAVVGTTNYVSKFTSGTVIGNSLIYDNGTNVGIGTTSPSTKLHVLGSTYLQGVAEISNIQLDEALYDTTLSPGTLGQVLSSGGTYTLWIDPPSILGTTNYLPKFTGGTSIGDSQVFDNGTNVGINTLNPSSASLHVNGNVFATSFTGSLLGTSSYTHQALSSSYSSTSSYALTASYASTASYVDILNQDVSINGNLNVVGTASFTYTTASIVQVGAATITLNTDNPATRFGGMVVVDSGSFGNSSTGSLLWDSQNNKWIYSNPSGSSYDGGMLISGPRNTTGLGNEVGTLSNYITKGQGGDHITSSQIYEDSSSNVGIGTSTPLTKLHIAIDDNTFAGNTLIENTNTGSSAQAAISFKTANNAGTFTVSQINANGGAVLYNGANAPMSFYTNASTRMTITAGGDVGIGTTSPSYPLHVATQVSNISIYADYDIVAFSDQSVKTNIRPIENVLERVVNSRGVLYDRTDSKQKDNIGFIAQELEIEFPELVVENNDGTKAVKYQNAVAVLFEAIKQQQLLIDDLYKKINTK